MGWIVLAAYTFGQFLFTPILGSLSDRIGRRPVIMFGLISNTIFFIAFGLAQGLWFALIVRFLAGAGNGNISVARAYIGDISTDEQLKARMGVIGAAFGLGFMIGPFIGGILTDPYTNFGGYLKLLGGKVIRISFLACLPVCFHWYRSFWPSNSFLKVCLWKHAQRKNKKRIMSSNFWAI